MKFIVENSNRYRNIKKGLFGDPSGRIRTFAIVSPQNPIGALGSDDEDYLANFLEYTTNKSKYNKEKTSQLSKEMLSKMIRRTGDNGLKIGNMSYVPLHGHYGEAELSYMIFNITRKDAEGIARDYGQESFFFGEVFEDKSIIEYYQTFNHCKSYKLIEKSSDISLESDAEDYFSKFGVKFRINMKVFSGSLPEIINEEMFNNSFDENRTFLSRSSCRRYSINKIPDEDI